MQDAMAPIRLDVLVAARHEDHDLLAVTIPGGRTSASPS
jgi:hypothetical protein